MHPLLNQLVAGLICVTSIFLYLHLHLHLHLYLYLYLYVLVSYPVGRKTVVLLCGVVLFPCQTRPGEAETRSPTGLRRADGATVCDSVQRTRELTGTEKLPQRNASLGRVRCLRGPVQLVVLPHTKRNGQIRFRIRATKCLERSCVPYCFA